MRVAGHRGGAPGHGHGSAYAGEPHQGAARRRPQLDNLDAEMTVRENLLMYARYFDLPREVAERREGALGSCSSPSALRRWSRSRVE